ncbi:MAG: hypothetical protein LBN98_02460, partial [Prevotellaceae bacterium]|nr:hypothetical protein [Prevotellaceae bacterium]
LLYLADEKHPRGSHAVLVSIKNDTVIDKLAKLECPDNTIYKAGSFYYVKGYNLQEEINGHWGDVHPEITTLGVEGDRIYAFTPEVTHTVIPGPAPTNPRNIIDSLHTIHPDSDFTVSEPAVHTMAESFDFTAQHVDFTEVVTITDQIGHTFTQNISNHLSIVAVYSFVDAADYYIVSHTIQLENQDLPDIEYHDNEHEIYTYGKGWDIRYGYGHGVYVDAFLAGDDNNNAMLISTHPATGQGSSAYAVGETIGFSGNVGNSGGSIGANVSFTNTTTTTIPDVSIENQSTISIGAEGYTVHYTIASPDSHGDWGRGNAWSHWKIETPCATAINLFAPEGSWIWKVPKAQGDNSTVQMTLHYAARTELSYGWRNIARSENGQWESDLQERWHTFNMTPPRRTP